MSKNQLHGKTVVITGAGGKLGRQLVQGFLDTGAYVVAAVRDPSKYDALWGGASGLEVAACDVTDEQSVRACFEAVGEKRGHVYGLVHAAGMWGSEPIETSTLAAWNTMLAVNLTSAYLCFRAVLPYMHEVGRLVAIASRQGADRGVSKQAAYSASKGGLIRLVESIAEEVSDRGITAHAVAPSTITDGTTLGGVSAADICDICLMLFSTAGASMNGAVIRAYG